MIWKKDFLKETIFSKKKYKMGVLIVVVIVGVAGMSFAYKSFTSKKDKQDDVIVENNISNIDMYIENCACPDELVKETKKELVKSATNKKKAELRQAKKRYSNWVDGIDFRKYINYKKYKNFGIIYLKDGKCNVNVRKGPGEKYDVVGLMAKYSGGKVLGSKKDSKGKVWYKIKSGDIVGYVISDYLKVNAQAKKLIPYAGSMVISADCDTLNVREKKSTKSKILDTVAKNETLPIKNVDGNWVKVQFDEDEKGKSNAFVAKQYTNLRYEIATAVPKIPDEEESDTSPSNDKDTKPSNNKSSNTNTHKSGNSNSSSTKKPSNTNDKVSKGGSAKGRAVAQEGLKYVGGRYVWGGSNLSTGVDCSGFTMRIYEKFGVKLPHSSRMQAGYGTSVSASSAQPGDLVFYSSGGTISHVAICIGNGKIVHASNPTSGIITSNMFWRQPTKVVRIF